MLMKYKYWYCHVCVVRDDIIPAFCKTCKLLALLTLCHKLLCNTCFVMMKQANMSSISAAKLRLCSWPSAALLGSRHTCSFHLT